MVLKKFLVKNLNYLRVGVLAFAGLLVVGLIAPEQLRAEMVVEKDKILLGNDYSVFSVKRGERARCRKACEDDRRCQAWTFVRPGADGIGQCRLKRDRSRGISNNCCVSGYKKFDFRDYGDDKRRRKQVEFCDGWALEAVKLHQQNRDNACGYRGRAWGSDADQHFRRCMLMDRNERRKERVGQRNAVKVCVAEIGLGKRARCDHYARVAVTQNTSRVKGACGGGSTERWSNKYKKHFSYCVDSKKAAVRAEQVAREKRLQQCFAFDQSRKGACHDYAMGAINHFRKNIEKGCDLHGNAWHNNYRRHVSWCRGASAKQRSRATSKRRLTLKTCRLFGKIRIQFR